MTFLSPIAALIAAALAIPPLVALYFLKLRRREMAVSSTLLWKKAIQDLQVNAPFQKLRRNLLLLIQLLLLLALLLAFARPVVEGQAVEGGRVVLAIDQSASMSATDVSGGRLEEAKDQAMAMVESLEPGTAAMVVAFADSARVLQPFTSDRSLLRRAIGSIEPTDRDSYLGPALGLIEPFVAAEGETSDLQVVVFSDGHLHDEQALAVRGGDLNYVRIGSDPATPTRNLAILALAARRDYDQPEQVQVLVRLGNFSPDPFDAHLTLKLEGQVQKVSQVSIPARAGDGKPGTKTLQFDMQMLGSALIEVEHDIEDQLAADNRAQLVVAEPSEPDVLLVSPGNRFLQRAIDAAGVRRLVVMSPNQFEQIEVDELAGNFDVVVFDRYSPQQTPAVGSLYLGAAPPIEGLELVAHEQGQAQTQVVLEWQRSDPLLEYARLDEVLMVEPGRLKLPTGGRSVATGLSGPLIGQVDKDGARHVVVGFDVLKSNWPMQVSFAVFVSNAMRSLMVGGGVEGAGLAWQPGQVVAAPLSEAAESVTYESSASQVTGAGQGRVLLLPPLGRVGLYEAQSDAVEPPFDRLAVNLADAVESDLQPVEVLEVAVADRGKQEARSAGPAQRGVWRWFVLGALVFLMLEWLVYTRRMSI